jgi:drug/metabolite transporter (DMT)-like permease
MGSPAITAAGERQARVDLLAFAGLGFSSLCWAAAFIAGKVVLAEMTPLAAAAWRYVVATAILLPFAIRQRPARGIADARGALAIMMLCGGVLYPWLFLAALARTSATNTSLLIALNPVFTVLLVPVIGEGLNRQRLTGVTLALAGAMVVITRGDLGHLRGLSLNTGDLLAVAAALTWAAFNLASRPVVNRLTPAFANCVIYGVGGAALYALAASESPWRQLRGASPAALGGVVMMAVLSSVLAGQLFLTGVRTLGVSRAVVFVYLVPVLTALLSAAFLGEALITAQAIGGLAVLSGVYWSTRNRLAA